MDAEGGHSDPLDASLDTDDWAVLALYGRAMLSAQLLEFTVFQLAHLDPRTPKDMERSMRQIDRLLNQPTRDQAETLVGLPEELREDLSLALDVRNILAHRALFDYRLEAAVSDDAHSTATAMFRAMIAFFGDVQSRLDALAEDRLDARGIERPYLDDEELEALMESLGRWAEDRHQPPDI